MAPLARDGDDATVQIAGFFIVLAFVATVALCGRLCGCMNSTEAAACVDSGITSACITCAFV
jgi:hypothetical protein